MRKFDTKVQHLRYKVLREVARYAWDGTLSEHLLDLPKEIIPGKTPTMRCCVYKERAILEERIKLAMGGDQNNPNIVEVIEIACDECPAAGFEVTDSCRGCLAHRCESACKVKAISFDSDHTAHIDKNKCIECGACAKACQFAAIIDRKRPCQVACKAKAISINEENAASINNQTCTQCGACIYTCPFGAISDKSQILKVIDLLKRKMSNQGELYAILAPAISSQFVYAKFGQAVTGLKMLGFDIVLETALGADMTAMEEAKELSEKGFLTSSCCPAFVNYVKSAFPQFSDQISDTPSPMAMLGKAIKERDPKASVVFIGPCTAKKGEIRNERVKPYIDAVITFEELQALYDSRDSDLVALDETKLDNASYFGRVFARSGGVTEAVAEALKEQGIDFEMKACVCDGIEQCRTALLRKNKNVLDANFIEGMACIGGCINGAGCLSHGEKNRSQIDAFGKIGKETITEAIESF